MTDEEISACFNRLLGAVQENARSAAAALTGSTGVALVEELDEKDPSLVTGRLSNNYLVHFQGDESLIGKYINVKLTENKGFYFIGERI